MEEKLKIAASTALICVVLGVLSCTQNTSQPRSTEPIAIDFSNPRASREMATQDTKLIVTDAEPTARTPQTTENVIQDENRVFEIPDRTAQFPEQGSFLAANNLCMERSQGQRIVVNFIVEKDGSITDINIMRGILGRDGVLLRWEIPESYHEEIIRILQSMPKWTPGTVGGEAVRSRITFPIPFRTRDDL